LTDEIVVITEA